MLVKTRTLVDAFTGYHFYQTVDGHSMWEE